MACIEPRLGNTGKHHVLFGFVPNSVFFSSRISTVATIIQRSLRQPYRVLVANAHHPARQFGCLLVLRLWLYSSIGWFELTSERIVICWISEKIYQNIRTWSWFTNDTTWGAFILHFQATVLPYLSSTQFLTPCRDPQHPSCIPSGYVKIAIEHGP